MHVPMKLWWQWLWLWQNMKSLVICPGAEASWRKGSCTSRYCVTLITQEHAYTWKIITLSQVTYAYIKDTWTWHRRDFPTPELLKTDDFSSTRDFTRHKRGEPPKDNSPLLEVLWRAQHLPHVKPCIYTELKRIAPLTCSHRHLFACNKSMASGVKGSLSTLIAAIIRTVSGRWQLVSAICLQDCGARNAQRVTPHILPPQ